MNLFTELTSVIASEYFAAASRNASDGLAVLESVCTTIENCWPTLIGGYILRLPLLGTVYQTIIPTDSQTAAQLLAAATAAENFNYSSSGGGGESMSVDVEGPQQLRLLSAHETDLFATLQPVLAHLHMLWELVLTAEPIVVIATVPTDCSAMVHALQALIAPLAYAAEARPYFTIQDSEFREFTQPQCYGGSNRGSSQLHPPPPPIIIGVTNPFFSKMLAHWPHIIRLGPASAKGAPVHLRKFKSKSSADSSNSLTGSGGGGGNNSRSLDQSPGIYTSYKPFIRGNIGGGSGGGVIGISAASSSASSNSAQHPNNPLSLRHIEQGIRNDRPSCVQSALLRRHLLELTQSFMIPLERYMASLMPLRRDISAWRRAPPPNPFRPDDFLATLATAGPQLTTALRGDWTGLYKRFFRSPNFRPWYEQRWAELQQKLDAAQLQALSDVVCVEKIIGHTIS